MVVKNNVQHSEHNENLGEPSTKMNVEEGKVDIRQAMRSQFKMQLEEESGMVSKSELEKYLLEACEEEKGFSSLGWWRSNSTRDPILSQLARDVLAIPVSTIALESAFSTGGGILDPYRSSLAPKVAEALICAQN